MLVVQLQKRSGEGVNKCDDYSEHLHITMELVNTHTETTLLH